MKCIIVPASKDSGQPGGSVEGSDKTDSSTSVDASVDSSVNLGKRGSRAKWREKQMGTFSKVPIMEGTSATYCTVAQEQAEKQNVMETGKDKGTFSKSGLLKFCSAENQRNHLLIISQT